MILEAVGIEKWYFRKKGDGNRFFAVNQTRLKLEPGIIVVLTGRSGSGKTTLMNMMAGLLSPDAGSIQADGQDLYAMNDEELSRFRNRHMAMIPQGADVFKDLTVMENILLPQGIYPKDRPKGTDAAAEAQLLLERLGIAGLSGVPARELSGGERRRVCTARALAAKPDILFADEPTSDLDDESMNAVLTLLREAADSGAAVFIVTHDAEALTFADTSWRMNAGSVEETRGSTD